MAVCDKIRKTTGDLECSTCEAFARSVEWRRHRSAWRGFGGSVRLVYSRVKSRRLNGIEDNSRQGHDDNDAVDGPLSSIEGMNRLSYAASNFSMPRYATWLVVASIHFLLIAGILSRIDRPVSSDIEQQFPGQLLVLIQVPPMVDRQRAMSQKSPANKRDAIAYAHREERSSNANREGSESVTPEISHVSPGSQSSNSIERDGKEQIPVGTLDLDALKSSARAMARETAPRQLPGVDRQLNESEKISDRVAGARRGDCRTEHAQFGLLAIPFLLKDAISDSGCKW